MMENICEWEADTILFFVCMMLVPGSVQSDIGWWRQQGNVLLRQEKEWSDIWIAYIAPLAFENSLSVAYMNVGFTPSHQLILLNTHKILEVSIAAIGWLSGRAPAPAL